MHNYKLLFVLLSCVFSLTSYAVPARLTPPDEPKENSFYICYDQRHVHLVVYSPFINYEKYQYVGCMITRTPCCNYTIREKDRPPRKLNLFAWFETYPQALNAFYRCAYSN